MKCAFCDSVWKTRKARGTRSAFSWTATFLWLLWIAAACLVVIFIFAITRFHRPTPNETPVETSNVSTVSFETAVETPVETPNATATPESAPETVPNDVDSSNDAAEKADLSSGDEFNQYKEAGNLDFRSKKPDRLTREEASSF